MVYSSYYVNEHTRLEPVVCALVGGPVPGDVVTGCRWLYWGKILYKY